MNMYCITLRSKWGEAYNVTLPGKSLDEVLALIILDPDWIFGSYSILGATA